MPTYKPRAANSSKRNAVRPLQTHEVYSFCLAYSNIWKQMSLDQAWLYKRMHIDGLADPS